MKYFWFQNPSSDGLHEPIQSQYLLVIHRTVYMLKEPMTCVIIFIVLVCAAIYHDQPEGYKWISHNHDYLSFGLRSYIKLITAGREDLPTSVSHAKLIPTEFPVSAHVKKKKTSQIILKMHALPKI